MEKKLYSLKGAFKRWCELTGDYGGGQRVGSAPIWFKIETLSKFHYTLESVGKNRKFKRNYRYSIELSDEELLSIKTHYRDNFMKQHKITNRHEYRTTYKEHNNEVQGFLSILQHQKQRS